MVQNAAQDFAFDMKSTFWTSLRGIGVGKRRWVAT